MKNSGFRSSVGDSKIKPLFLKDSLDFVEHQGSVVKTIISTENRVNGAFVNYTVENLILEIHFQNVHNLPTHFWFIFISVRHHIYYVFRYINVYYIFKTLFVHLLRKFFLTYQNYRNLAWEFSLGAWCFLGLTFRDFRNPQANQILCFWTFYSVFPNIMHLRNLALYY